MGRVVGTFLIAALAGFGGVATAQAPAGGMPPLLCGAPADFAGWVRPLSLVAAMETRNGPVPAMQMGQAATVTLSPTQQLRPVVQPGKAGGPLSYGGLLRVRAPIAATYRFALSGPVWLDVVDRSAAAVSTGHFHGYECAPTRKFVDLPLSAGDHIVQLAAATTPNVTIMAIRVLP